jgi:hypothetical protein
MVSNYEEDEVSYCFLVLIMYIIIIITNSKHGRYNIIDYTGPVLPVGLGHERSDIADVEGFCLDLALREVLCDVIRFETLDSQLSQLLQGQLKEEENKNAVSILSSSRNCRR